MIVKKNIDVFQCEYCSKKLFRKHAMVNHELKCSMNPINIRACFNCDFCEKIEIKYEGEPQTFGNNDLRSSNSFKCTKKQTFMFPPKVEYGRGAPGYVEFNGEEIIQEKMPLKCEFQKEESIEDWLANLK